MNHIRFTHLFLLSLLVYVLLSQPAFGGQPVDPATLNPPPPPGFNPVCEKDGQQTICTVQFSDPPSAGGSGVICETGAGAYEVFQFQNRSVVGLRYYDANGNLTRKIFREDLIGTFTNPLTHTALSFDGRDTNHVNLTVPGDTTSGTVTITGSFHVHLPNAGQVIFEAGRTVNLADGTFVSESGPHPFQDYFVFGDTAAIQPLCNALQ